MRKNAVTSSMNMTSIKSKGPVFDPGLCRCCGSMRKCRLLNVEYKSLGKKEVYSDMIMDCFGLLLSHLDGKPTERLVCATCVGRLREAASFKQQVLQCEETFIQVKLQYTDDEPKPCAEVFLDGGDAAKVEVKIEPQECDAGQTSHDDAAADDDYEDVKSELPVDESSNDDLPLSERVSNKIVKRNPAKIERPKKSAVNGSRISPGQGFKKTGVPMAKVQQMIRERDPSYMIETNILTIVEYSYVCPFKCRHNHLLCYYCGKNYSDPHELRQHTLTMHHPKKFKVIEHKKMIKIDLTRIDCRLCSAKIDNLEEFKRHVSSLHNKKYYFDYKDSVLPFKLTSGDLNCALCDETFPYFHALNKHMNEHFSNYVCETCGLGFVDKSRWKMHQQRHEEGDFPCETCGKVFKAQYNRDLHIDRVHKKKGRVYCPKCDMKLMSYPQKLKHLVEVHGEEPLSFPCNICGKIYETRRTLTIHKRKEHLKDYRYECQYCGQKFFTRFALNNHMPTHTGERNFKCKVCEKTYPRLKTLKDHMRIHTNDRRYRCHICGQAFIQNCSLKGHMKSQHSEYG